MLTVELRCLGAVVDRHGSAGVPYDQDRGGFHTTAEIVAAADQLAAAVDLGGYDVISVHFGNVEIEQLLVHRFAIRRGTTYATLLLDIEPTGRSTSSTAGPLTASPRGYASIPE